ncbi:MAG: hypothetical protein SFW66_02030, partial [Gammaproteobacteria bacterium]|nr:hypothetical protein [Gammaproteobacteria bacterium]
MSKLIKLISNGLKSDLFQLKYSNFIEQIQRVIPEAQYLKGTATVSAEGIAENAAKELHGFKMADEEMRAFSGLLRFKDVIKGDEVSYQNFIECQKDARPPRPVLSYQSFQEMGQYVRDKLTTPEDCAAAIWSVLCNDLGKVHEIVYAYKALYPDSSMGHDAILAKLLNEKPELFPAFAALPAEQRRKIIAGYASGCDISQFEQLELPIVSLEALKILDKQSLDMYILHSIFDVSGAAAHFKSNGSLTMHQQTWDFFNATQKCLGELANVSIETAYLNYLNYRGTCIGIENNSEEATALIRIAGMARLATPEQGKMLKKVWNRLTLAMRNVLTKELNVHGGTGSRAIFVGYGVAILLNPQGAKQKILNEIFKPEEIKT